MRVHADRLAAAMSRRPHHLPPATVLAASAGAIRRRRYWLCSTAPNAHITLYFDRRAVAETLRLAPDTEKAPVEVSLNLHRVEKYPAYLRKLTAGDGPGRN